MLGPIAKSASPASPRLHRFAPSRRFALAALCPALLALAGCSTSAYPSLARRAEEKPAGAPAPSVAVVTQDGIPAELATRVDALCRAAQETDKAFAAARPAVDKALDAAAHATPGDEAWQRANLALSDLEKQRGALGVVEGDMEALYTQDRLDHAPENPDQPRAAARLIEAARAKITIMAEAQDKVLRAARRKLPQ